jgi:lysine 2,3-aminomutase
MDVTDEEYVNDLARNFDIPVHDRKEIHSAPFLFKDLSISMLNEVDPELIHEIKASGRHEEARGRIMSLLHRRRMYLHSRDCTFRPLERINALACLDALFNSLSERSDDVSESGTLDTLLTIVRGEDDIPAELRSFYLDICHIIRGSVGRSGIYSWNETVDEELLPVDVSTRRSKHLDSMSFGVVRRVLSYPCGLDPDVVERRKSNRKLVLDVLGGSLIDWDSYQWQLEHVIKSVGLLGKLIELSPEEEDALQFAEDNHLPFGITPYYASLMDPDFATNADHALRSQVIPKREYLEAILEARPDSFKLDFMKEQWTSPIDLVTRRYPMIAVFKPYNSCAQICSYCQRNWQVKGVLEKGAMAPRDLIEQAMVWFEEHPMVSEVLITGGDPVVMPDSIIGELIDRFAAMPHIRRIRIGTRLPVVLPMRFTQKLVETLSLAHSPPTREVCIVTHFEHSYEVTPEATLAVQMLRRNGIMVYNQQVFTFENCRRFETAALRLALKNIGVDPYYSFNTKGKEETAHFRVPIARLLQEREEEARLLPGLDRTDEPVFNVPALGKNYLRAGQHRNLVGIAPDGGRVYEFHPWEKNITEAPLYVYKDVPIAEFLYRLAQRGEDLQEYRSIWYYF